MSSNAHIMPVVTKSKIPKETHRFTWIIADFLEVKRSKELLESLSVTFEMGRSIGLPVTFEAYLEAGEGVDEGWIGWYLQVVKAPEGVKKVMGKHAIKIGNYVELKEDEPLEYVVRCNSGGWGWSDCVWQEDDVSFLPLDANGGLPIQIEVTLYNHTGTSYAATVTDVMANFQGIFSGKLSEDMEMLYKDPTAYITSGTPTIVSVVSKDGRKISALAAHLAARSPVFRTMFQTPMTEVKEGVVKMEDIGAEALEVFLHFLHTATLKDNWKETAVLEELAYAAHKYLMQDLLEFLDEAIGLVCTSANCVPMIRLVNRLELKKAEETLLKMYRDQWKEATDLEEMRELLQE